MQRIAGILLALAILADRATSSSLFVRRLVLWLLRPAEAFARAFAAECGCVTPWPVADDFAVFGCDDSPDNAARLARQFRALAAVFAILALLTLRHAAKLPSRPPRHLRNAARRVSLIAALRPRYADTS